MQGIYAYAGVFPKPFRKYYCSQVIDTDDMARGMLTGNAGPPSLEFADINLSLVLWDGVKCQALPISQQTEHSELLMTAHIYQVYPNTAINLSWPKMIRVVLILHVPPAGPVTKITNYSHSSTAHNLTLRHSDIETVAIVRKSSRKLITTFKELKAGHDRSNSVWAATKWIKNGNDDMDLLWFA